MTTVAEAAELVLRGKVIAFPTETVYGLMALPERAERIYEVKRRPAEKQLVVMAADVESLASLVSLSPRNRAYAERYWPGPLTLVLPAAGRGAPSVGARIPDHPLALELLRAVGRPVVTTSANLSGEPPALTAGDVRLEGVAAVLDGGRARGGVPSTVLLADRPDPEVTREGAIPGRELLLFDQAWKMRLFAEREALPSSPIWHATCERLDDEPAALEILLQARPGQRRPNLLLGAMHYLLLGGARHRLAEYFPSVGGRRELDEALGDAVADFVLAYRDPLGEVVRTHSTQTNEVGRSAVLLLALTWLPQPIALIDAGASAGLNLRLDRFRYRFGDRVLGGPGSPVELEVHWRDRPPPTPSVPTIAWRAGLDQSPLDPADPESARWLAALVWPEHEERRRRLLAAIEVARAHPVELRRGDLVDDLPPLVEEARRHARTVAVVHSQVLTYLPAERARRFVELCQELGVWRIGLEGVPDPPGASALTMNGERVALVEPHGRWIDWLTPVNEDGEPITTEQPRGASVGVYRQADRGVEWLMLHRCKDGAGYEGDWAWGPPAGSRLPGEPSGWCARRELREETGLDVEAEPAGSTGRWDVYTYEAPIGWEPLLSAEHDRCDWLPAEAALERSRPAAAGDELRLAVAAGGQK